MRLIKRYALNTYIDKEKLPNGKPNYSTTLRHNGNKLENEMCPEICGFITPSLISSDFR